MLRLQNQTLAGKILKCTVFVDYDGLIFFTGATGYDRVIFFTGVAPYGT